MPSLSVYVILGWNSAMLVLSLAYFRHRRVSRPPIGVFNLSDVLLAVLFITLAHVVYVVLPLWLAVGVFALAVLSAVYFTLEPLVRTHALAWIASLAVIALDIGAARIFGTQTDGFLLINDVVILLVIATLALIDQPWPGMIFLAPLMLGQYLY